MELSPGTNGELTRITVLLIEDSDGTRAETTRLLVSAGMHVVGLPSAIGATRAIVDNDVDVVVVDESPSLRGDWLVALFRGTPRLEHLAVVLLSNGSGAELERLQKELGADAVLSRSERGDLPEVARRALLTRRASRPRRA